MTTNQTPTDRIEKLDNRFWLIARQYAIDGFETDDIHSVIVEAVLRESKPEDSNTKILQLAKWRAQGWCKREARLAFGSVTLGNDDGEDEGDFVAEYIPATTENPEDIVIKREMMAGIRALVAKMDSRNRKILEMTAAGFRQNEIAEELGISPSAVNQRLTDIREKANL